MVYGFHWRTTLIAHHADGVRKSLAHRGDETLTLEVVNGRGIESLLRAEVGAALASLEVHFEFGHAVRHWHLDLWGEGGRLHAVMAVECGAWLEALCLGKLGSEAGQWHVLYRVADATGRLHLDGLCARAEAVLGWELVMHRLLAVIAEGLLRGETRLEDGAICAKCSHFGGVGFYLNELFL